MLSLCMAPAQIFIFIFVLRFLSFRFICLYSRQHTTAPIHTLIDRLGAGVAVFCRQQIRVWHTLEKPKPKTERYISETSKIKCSSLCSRSLSPSLPLCVSLLFVCCVGPTALIPIYTYVLMMIYPFCCDIKSIRRVASASQCDALSLGTSREGGRSGDATVARMNSISLFILIIIWWWDIAFHLLSPNAKCRAMCVRSVLCCAVCERSAINKI